MTTDNTIKLPPLPEGTEFIGFENDPNADPNSFFKMIPSSARLWFTSEQMQGYATAAVEAAEARHAEEIKQFALIKLALLLKMNDLLEQQAARHSEELAAYEVTVDNLRAPRSEPVPVATVRQIFSETDSQPAGLSVVPHCYLPLGTLLYTAPPAPQHSEA
jgi:hypothetical protein